MILGDHMAFRPFSHFPMRDLPPLSDNVRDACINCGGGPTPETRFVTRAINVDGHAPWCPFITGRRLPIVHQPSRADHDAHQMLARALRAGGASIEEIARVLEQPEMTVWRWVSDIPVPVGR